MEDAFRNLLASVVLVLIIVAGVVFYGYLSERSRDRKRVADPLIVSAVELSRDPFITRYVVDLPNILDDFWFYDSIGKYRVSDTLNIKP